MILASWPGSSLYVIGTFFSVALLFDGLSLVALSLGARRILGLVREDEAAAGRAGAEEGPAVAGKRPEEDQEQSHN